ncbi:hypothetical protein BT63DRAFT_425936 [Microthyrium microscopicum]|uniref:Uncharacterized protein n=1 Tax=Microthyrium microscopicum TaxID=703497 RepID=A0A6A6U8R2_9PEZI|nr:hypothetical protein BT63DRAFT_425936 [Microthyrium microscopicum]
MDRPPPPPNPHFSPLQERPPMSYSQSSAPPAQPSYYPQPPNKQHQPMQIPFSDPFRSRPPDPFFPNPQQQPRQEGYGPQLSREGSAMGHASRESVSSGWSATSGM